MGGRSGAGGARAPRNENGPSSQLKPRSKATARAIGPDGTPLTLDDLPPPDTERWVIRRKATVVAAVRSGLLSLEEACRRYHLSVEEFLSWARLLDAHGMRGLRSTRSQYYRSGRRAEAVDTKTG